MDRKYATGILAMVLMGFSSLFPVASPESMTNNCWRVICVVAFIAGIASLWWQARILGRSDKERDAILQKILEQTSGKPKAFPLETNQQPQQTTQQEPIQPLNGELYRIFSYPRVGLDYELFKKVRRVAGTTNPPSVDCDVLLWLRLVNTSTQTRYLQGIRGSVEVEGKRKIMELQNDFRLQHAFAGSVEYGWDVNPNEAAREPGKLKPLIASWGDAIQPQQPTSGWVRFLLRDIDPDKINSNTWQFSAVDSLGNEYPIIKTADPPEHGEIALRRVEKKF